MILVRQIRQKSLIALLGGGVIAATLAFGTWHLATGLYIQAKAVVAQNLLDRAWNVTLASGAVHKPWTWADTWPVARLEVPRLGESAIILAGASGEAMAFGPGLMHGTPQPGEAGTSIISAHRDTHFAFLRNIVIGDEVNLTRSDGRTIRFRVTKTAIVDARASGIDPAAAGRHLALVTCYPFGSTEKSPNRYVVFAEPLT